MRRREVSAVVMATTMVVAFAAGPAYAQDLSLNVDPATVCVEATDTVTVTLDSANLPVGINGVQVRLEYDNTLMTLVEIVPWDLSLTFPDEGWIEISQTDTDGDVDWAAVVNGNSTGDGLIATLTFTAIANGAADVKFRLDSPPFRTKLTRASDAGTIIPTKVNSGGIFIGPAVCVMTADDPVCEGSTGNDASVPDAGLGATYDWTVTGGLQETPDDLFTMTYTAGAGPTVTIDVTVTDPNGCVSTCQEIVSVDPRPTGIAGSDIALCADAADPTVGGAPTATGGTAPYTYLWTGTAVTYLSSTFSSNPTFDVSLAGVGSYQACVIVSDTNICASVEDCATITINAVPAAGAGSDITLCEDAVDPAVGGSPTASGGAGPYTYSWTGSGAVFLSSATAANPTFAVAAAGPDPGQPFISYQVCVTVTDSNTCVSTTDCATVTINDVPVADAGADVAVCEDVLVDPSVGGAPTASGGTGLYSYSWTGTAAVYLSGTTVPNPTFDVTTAGPGSYQACITVTDSEACVSTADCAFVTISALPVADAGADITVCADAADPAVGGAQTGSGGTSPYTYSWTGSGAIYLSSTTAANPTFDVSTPTPGSYQVCVTVTDASTCTSATDCATVTIDAVPVANAGTDITACANNTDPTVGGGPTAEGGTGPYTYTWTGTGSIYLSDTIVANPTFDVATAGPSSFQVCVTVTDANTCVSVTDCATVTVYAFPTADAGSDVALCADGADPMVGGPATGSGGLGPYTYLWTGGGATYLSDTTAANPTFDVATAGGGSHQVCVTVTDVNGCDSAVDCATVTVRALPIANAGSDFALCANASDPVVGGSPTASGGTSPYTYAWTGTGTAFLSSLIVANPTFDVSVAGVGSYDICVTVTDANSCVSATDCAIISVSIVLDCSITTTDPVCSGTTHDAQVGDAGLGATYDWEVTGGTQDTPDDLFTMTYTAGAGPTVTIDVIVTDISACTNTCQTIVTVASAPPVASAGADLAICEDAGGQVIGGVPTGSGGTAPYTYDWTGAAAAFLDDITAANPTFDVATAGPGSYEACVTVTDVNSCFSAADCTTVTVNPLSDCSISAESLVCAGTGGHIASVTVPGATSYVWGINGGAINSGQGTTAINYTAGTGTSLTIDITVTDANGCVSLCQQVVTVNAPDCTILAADDVCYQSVNNFASVPPADPATYGWVITGGTITTGQGTLSIQYDAGTGTSVTLVISVTNANGCINTCQKIVNIIQPSIDVTLQLEGVLLPLPTDTITRDVTFVVTECGGDIDTRVVPVTVNDIGFGSVSILNTSAAADWISMQEGHTLRRSRQVNYGTCMVALVTRTGSGSLLTGDFHLGAVGQDNLCDITDFSILATLWNEAIDPSLSTGGDATGNGLQDTEDFSAMQGNFFAVGEPDDSCAALLNAPDGGQPVDAEPVPTAGRLTARAAIAVEKLNVANAERADLNGDGIIDSKDIRAFARRHGLELLPSFRQKLDRLEAKKSGRVGRRR